MKCILFLSIVCLAFGCRDARSTTQPVKLTNIACLPDRQADAPGKVHVHRFIIEADRRAPFPLVWSFDGYVEHQIKGGLALDAVKEFKVIDAAKYEVLIATPHPPAVVAELKKITPILKAEWAR